MKRERKCYAKERAGREWGQRERKGTEMESKSEKREDRQQLELINER